jgi:adenylate kinase family enzyme
MNNLFEQPVSKVNIIGTSATGKSTFARKLAAMLDFPYVEMDKIFWGPNWKWPSDEEFFANLKDALEQPNWILDGNYTRTVPVKWEKVELVIWLDYSFLRTLFQAVRRATARAWTKEELWEGTGNKESFRKSFFSKESIIWWAVKNHGKVRKKYEAYLVDKKFEHIKFVRLRSHAEADSFLMEWKRARHKEELS